MPPPAARSPTEPPRRVPKASELPQAAKTLQRDGGGAPPPAPKHRPQALLAETTHTARLEKNHGFIEPCSRPSGPFSGEDSIEEGARALPPIPDHIHRQGGPREGDPTGHSSLRAPGAVAEPTQGSPPGTPPHSAVCPHPKTRPPRGRPGVPAGQQQPRGAGAEDGRWLQASSSPGKGLHPATPTPAGPAGARCFTPWTPWRPPRLAGSRRAT